MNIPNKLLNIGIDKGITLNGLDCFINSFNKKSLIHIYGGQETGKTTFALNLINKNPDKSFIYIDTYYNIKHTPDNCLLFPTAREKVIIDFLKKLKPGDCDVIILDAYSNILSNTESWNAKSYTVMQDALEHIHTLAIKLNCTLILLNTTRYDNNAYNNTNYLKLNSTYVLKLIEFNYNSNVIYILPIKSNIPKEVIKYVL